MLFKGIKKVNLKVNELVTVKLFEGDLIAGVVDKVEDEHFWLRVSPDPNSQKQKFSFKIDQVFKSN
jgi:hypothetical protein